MLSSYPRLLTVIITLMVIHGTSITGGGIIVDAFHVPSSVSSSSRSYSNNMIKIKKSTATLSSTSDAGAADDNVADIPATTTSSSRQSRRDLFHQVGVVVSGGITATAASAATMAVSSANAADSNSKTFAPGGTLVDYEVGVNVGNTEASLTRKADNSNVIFDKDYYFKFGTAPTWITSENEFDFPKTMPFTPSQQRYDTLKKYKSRIETSIYTNIVNNIGKDAIPNNTYNNIPDPTSSSNEYSIRAMGLLANGFLASENTGTTNELFLARWYINEIYLRLIDIRTASDQKTAQVAYNCCIKAINSYLRMLNRVITSKVGEKFDIIEM